MTRLKYLLYAPLSRSSFVTPCIHHIPLEHLYSCVNSIYLLPFFTNDRDEYVFTKTQTVRFYHRVMQPNSATKKCPDQIAHSQSDLDMLCLPRLSVLRILS